MKENQALDAFAAISNKARLRIVRMLVTAGADGKSAGAIADALDRAAPSKVSFHLNQLESAGLVESRREGRSIIYSAIFPALSDLVAFLMKNCCEGHCKVCDKAIELFAKCTGRPTTTTGFACTVAGDERHPSTGSSRKVSSSNRSRAGRAVSRVSSRLK